MSTLCENWSDRILGHIFHTSFTKKTFWPTWKFKMVLLFIKVINSHSKHCLPCKCAPIYQIWAHYHKLWCIYGHDFGHLAWNTSMFVHGRPYREASFFKSCQNSCLPFFMATSTRKRTPCASFTFFYFSLFSLIFFKTGSNLSACKFIARSWIFENSRWFSLYWLLGYLKSIFCKI